MKAGADSQTQRSGSKPSRRSVAKASGSKVVPSATYQAEILGQLLEVSGWEDGKWLLAGGTRYGFTPLREDGPGFHSQKLLAVSLLRFKDGEWMLNDEPLERLAGADAEASSMTYVQNPQDKIPRRFRRIILRDYLAGDIYPYGIPYHGTDKESVRAVAWFEGEDEEGDPVLLRDFWKDESPAAPPANYKACPTCGWQHEQNDFTQMLKPGKALITLPGICRDIVAFVHAAHEAGQAKVSTKDPNLLERCGSTHHPRTVFNQRKRGAAYDELFRIETGFIALKDFVSIARQESTSGST